MKTSILIYLIIIYCSVDAMELRSRKIVNNSTCLGCYNKDVKDSEKKLPKLNDLTQEEARLYRQRVFSEVHQKTPVCTLIVGSVAICCSGLLLLWGEYEKSK